MSRCLANRTLCLAIAFLIGARCGVSAENESTGDSPLRFRRVYAPVDRVKDWPTENQRLIPVEPEEFEKLVAKLRTTESRTAAPEVSLSRATYLGVFKDENLTGTLQWEVSAIDGPTRVPITPCSLDFHDCRWAGMNKQAVLGVAPDGELTLLADRAGTVNATWTATGRRTASGSLEFNLRLPRCPMQRLELDLPDGWIATANVGVVVAHNPDTAKPGHWTFELGGHREIALELQRADALTQSRQMPLVRTATTYEFTSRGLNVTAIWRLEAYDEPLREVTFVLDPGLQLIGAKYGDASLSWTSDPSGPTEPTRIAMRLPQPLRGVGRPLRIEAVASTVLDRADVLPRIHPTKLAWQEGQMTLVVPEPYVVQQFDPFQCRQIRTSPLPDPLEGESIELQCFAADATARWMVGRKTPRLRVNQGLHIAFDEGTSSATIVLDAKVDSGERFNLSAEIDPRWAIESVESQPVGRIGDWSVDAPIKATSTLNIRLSTPISVAEPLRLRVLARGPAFHAGETIPARQLDVLQLPRMTVESNLLALGVPPEWSVRLDDDYHLTRLSFAGLTAVEQELLPSASDAQIVRLDSNSYPWRLRLEPRRAQLTARIDIQATVDHQTLGERYEIECLPMNDAIERLIIHFTHARVESPQWRFTSGDPGRFRVRRLSAEQQTALELPVAGETWELTFNDPQREKFQLRATRRTTLGQEAPLSLMVIPDASEQRGELTVHASADLPLVIENRRLTATLPEGHTARGQTIRQAFQYDPRRVIQADVGPHISVRRLEDITPIAATVIEKSLIEVQVSPDGSLIERVTWSIRNHGREAFDLRIPTERLVLADIVVDGARIDFDPEESSIPVPLASSSLSQVQLLLRGSHEAFRWSSRISIERPEVDLPIVAEQALVWLPPSYQMSTDERLDGTTSWRRLGECWFGPFVRRDDENVFDPVSLRDWVDLAAGKPIELTDIVDRSLIALGQVDDLPGDVTSSDHWLQRWGRNLAADEIMLWGPSTPEITPSGQLKTSSATASDSWQTLRQRGAAKLLHRAQAMIVVDRTVVAVPLAVAQRATGLLTPLEVGVYRLRNESISAEAAVASLLKVCPSLVPASGAKNVAVTKERMKFELGNLATPGWKPFKVTLSLKQPLVATIILTPLITAGSVTLFAVSLLLLVWTARHRSSLHIPLCISIWSIALLAAAPWNSLASALSLGAFFSCGMRFLPRSSSANAGDSRRRESGMTSRLARTATLLTLVLLLMSTKTNAQPRDAAPAKGPAQSVFIPIGEDQKPSGGSYLVPPDLYAEMRRRVAALSGAQTESLTTGADYRLVFTRDTDTGGLEFVECRASYEINVSNEGAELSIPLSFASSAEEPFRGVLDGRPVDLSWDESRRHLRAVSGEAGSVRLDLILQPDVMIEGDRKRLHLRIPPVAGARLEVQLPADAARVELASAMGIVEWSDDRRRLTAALGPTVDLDLRWPTMSAQTNVSTVDIDELAWLRVRPGSVAMDLTLRAKVVQGTSRSLSLLVDPRWRLLPGKNDNQIDKIETLPGDPARPDAPRTLVIHLRQPITDSTAIRLSFLQSGASGIGVIRLPPLESLGGRMVRRWQAISVDAALDHEFKSPDAVIVDAENFMTQWGQAGAAPQLVLDRSSGDTAVNIATRPKEPEIESQQHLQLTAQRDGFAVRYEADITTTNSATFQHRLSAPVDLVVDDVSVLEDGDQQAARWSQLPNGDVIVFLSGPASGKHSLSLRGFLQAAKGGFTPLPGMAIAGAKVSTSRVTLLREASATVQMDRMQGLEAIEPEDLLRRNTRLVGAWRSTGDQPLARLQLQPNDPHASLVSITTLRANALSWSADIELLVSVEQGILDSLRMEVPRSCAGPFTLSPPLDHELLDIPNSTHQLLVITPRIPISDLLRLKLVSPLKVSAGQFASWSGMRPLLHGSVERYLRLPHTWGPQPIAWEIEGLRTAPLPEELANFSDAAQFDTFRVTTGKNSAQLRPVQNPGVGAQIRLADVHIDGVSDNRATGRVAFDLEPGALQSLLLLVPTGCELLQVDVDGFMQTPLAVDNQHWRVPLLSELPQQVQVRFRTALPVANGWPREAILAVPTVEDIPIVNSLWTTVHKPIAFEPLAQRRTQADAYRAALVRWQTAMAVFDHAAGVAAWQGTEQWQNWSAHCRERLNHDWAEAQLRRNQWQALGSPVDAAEWAALDRQWERIRESLAKDASAIAPRSGTTVVDEMGTVIVEPSAIFLFPGQVSELPVRIVEPSHAEWLMRVGMALAFALLCLVASFAAKRISWRVDLLARWANPLGVAVGIAWWLWLSPSWLGLLLAVVSAYLSLRSGLKTTAESHSNIVRLPVAVR